MAAGGFFCLIGYALAVVLIARHTPAWSAGFLCLPFSLGISCFLQARRHLCAFRGLTDASSVNKALILWLQALGGSFLIAALVFLIMLKGPFINNI